MGFEELIALFVSWIQLIVPQPCFDEFFVNYNFFEVNCLKIVISKCLGYGIILGSVLVKVPQIVKILTAGSAEGISIISVTLELVALSGTIAYSYAKEFPFSAYGEAAFLILQTATIAFLVLCYTGNCVLGVLYIVVYCAILAFLMSSLAPMSLLWLLQASVVLLVVTARMIQAVTNYRNKGTGQLSAITVSLLFLGAIGRIFTSLQETGDPTVFLIYVVSSACNGILLAQLIYYSKEKVKESEKAKVE